MKLIPMLVFFINNSLASESIGRATETEGSMVEDRIACIFVAFTIIYDDFAHKTRYKINKKNDSLCTSYIVTRYS